MEFLGDLLRDAIQRDSAIAVLAAALGFACLALSAVVVTLWRHGNKQADRTERLVELLQTMAARLEVQRDLLLAALSRRNGNGNSDRSR